MSRPIGRATAVHPRIASPLPERAPQAVPEAPLPPSTHLQAKPQPSWAGRLAPFLVHAAAVAAVLVGASMAGVGVDPPSRPAPAPAAAAAADVTAERADRPTALTPERRALLATVRGMLGKDKLGGQDGAFNLADVDAVVEAMMKDETGLGKAVADKLRKEGELEKAEIVEKAFQGGGGLRGTIARGMVRRQAPGEIRTEMAGKLIASGASESTGATADPTPRTVTFAEMQAFSDASDRLRQLQARIADELGFVLTFPNGLSAEAIDFMLSGRPGLPPGAKITPKPSAEPRS
jgi:hypothetical protein